MHLSLGWAVGWEAVRGSSARGEAVRAAVVTAELGGTVIPPWWATADVVGVREQQQMDLRQTLATLTVARISVGLTDSSLRGVLTPR